MMHTDSVAITDASHQFDMALEAKSSRQKCGICCIPIAARGVLDCCSDIFCFSCIDTWSAFTNLCPLCKLQFKFITFVPVAEDEDSSDVETQEAFFDFLGQERVESWIDDSEEDGTLSFPSYFIEEDAVVCLDADGCRVRKGLTKEDGESGLEDTSVACDACDCWYHASCVGYKPDSQGERSWICPRCVGTGVLDLFKFQPPTKNFTSKVSSKSMSLDKDGSFTFVDEGETAVVVSMDASFRSMSDHVDQALSVKSTGMLGILSENRLDELFVKAVEDTDKKCAGALTGAADSSLSDSGIVASDVSLIHREKIADVDNPAFVANSIEETVSIKPASAGIEDAENFPSEVALVKDVKKDDSSFLLPSTNDAVTTNSASGAEKSYQVSGEDGSNDSLIRRSQKFEDGDDVLESNNIGCKREVRAAQEMEHSKQVISSNIQRDHSPFKRREPPHSILEKNKREKKKLKSEDRELVSTNQSMVLGENLSGDTSRKPAQPQVPDKQSIKAELIDKMPIKEELVDPVLDEVMLDQCTDLKPDAVSMQEVFKPKSEVMDELKELVQGLAPSHRRVILPHTKTTRGSNGTSEGVRTGKIIYRGSVQDGKTSKIMNEIRQHLKREAVDFGIAGDSRKVDVTDEKFFVAFKAAIQSSQASLKQQLPSVKKMYLQKSGSKRDASRQSLMKKLYGGTGKRRQAWDRDWDISFWRERVSNDKRARQSSKALLQQEMVHMEEAIQNSKEGNKAELDSLRSRVYLADTSLLPRQTDIKPLSEQSSHKTNPVTARPICNAKTAQGLSKHSTSSSEGTNAAERDNSSVSMKTDKRKWALEVLARKTGQQGKRPRNQGSLLAELPEHMRPVLEYDRRSKVPTATRQVQLDRFIEYYLQKAPIEYVNDNPECQAAISAAVTQEKEIYDKSNSKGVYVNLCVQTLTSLSKVATPKAEEASSLEAAKPSSLLAAEPSPLATVETSQNGDIAVLVALKATGLISDSPPASPAHDGQESSCKNPPDMDKGFEGRNGQDGSSSIPDMDNSSHAVDCPSLENLESSCHELTEAQREVSCGNGMENAGGEEASIGDSKQDLLSPCMDNHVETIGGDGDLNAVTPQTVMNDEKFRHKEEKFQHKEADYEQHGSLSDTPSQEGTLTIITSERRVAEKKEAAQKEVDDHEVHCSSIDMPVQERASANSQGTTTETRVEDALLTSENVERITKQVERYVKDHIRPLHRSHVITTDQYIWAVSKTTSKVMQHHAGAKSADFLICEGEKVRRLAEQYLQLYSEHMLHGMN